MHVFQTLDVYVNFNWVTNTLSVIPMISSCCHLPSHGMLLYLRFNIVCLDECLNLFILSKNKLFHRFVLTLKQIQKWIDFSCAAVSTTIDARVLQAINFFPVRFLPRAQHKFNLFLSREDEENEKSSVFTQIANSRIEFSMRRCAVINM